jgi:hypothetical protein
MKFTLKTTIVAGVVFALVCLAVAVTGFTALRDISDPVQAADSRGFAWFWTFLAAVSAAFAGLAWWVLRGQGSAEDSDS